MSKKAKVTLFIIVALVAVALACYFLLFFNKAQSVVYSTFYTGNENNPSAEAVAIKDGKYMYVGSKEGAKQYVGPFTQQIDNSDDFGIAEGVDAHTHGYIAIESMYFGVDLSTVYTSAEYEQKTLDYIAQNPGRDIYLGKGWRNQMFEGLCPTTQQLSKLNIDTPIAITSADAHSLWCNEAMLKKCGITKDTPEIEGGIIERYADGTPNGCFREAAQGLIKAYIPDFTTEQYYEAIPKYLDNLASLGWTSYTEVLIADHKVNKTIFDAYNKLGNEGKLSMPVNIAWTFFPQSDDNMRAQMQDVVACRNSINANSKLKLTDTKFFIDGVVEGETAYLSVPYANEQTFRGLAIWEGFETELLQGIALSFEYGFQPHFHVIGDSAAKMALDGIEAARKLTGNRDLPCILTHVQLIQDQDISRLKDLNVIVAANFAWGCKMPGLFDNIESYYLSPKIAESYCYMYKDMLDTGIVMSGATDYPPGEFKEVLDLINTGATRTYRDKTKTQRDPSQCLTREEILNAMTIGGMTQEQRLDTRGTIEVGKCADMVLFKNNLLTCADSELYAGNKVVMTMVDGNILYNAED